MAMVIGKAPAPRGNKNRKKGKLREQAFKQIARQYPHLVEDESKRQQLWGIIQNTNIAIDGNGDLKMFYKGEEK